MMRRLGWLRESDEGVSMIMLAFSLLLLMGAAAVAVDLAAVRYDLRAAQLASDAASTAGAIHIDPVSGSDAEEACQVAWEYLLENIEDEGPTTTPPNCASFSGSCPVTARVEPASAGPYSFEIVHPVPDDHEFMAGQSINSDIDGAACQRLGVSVERTRNYTFGRVIGFVAGTPESNSVARIAVRPGEGELVPLLVLEPTACDALTVKGGGSDTLFITVDSFDDVPGLIVVDSAGTAGSPSCGNNKYTIDANDNQLNWIRALDVPGGASARILSYAAKVNDDRDFDDNDVDPKGAVVASDDPPHTWWRLYPTPMAWDRVTRAAIDWRYDCHTSYPKYLNEVDIQGCNSGDDPHITNLRAQYGSGDPGFDQWTTCTVDGPLTITGSKWIRCPSGFVVQSGEVTFEGGDLVFDGGIQVKSHGQLRINPNPGPDRVVFMRSGDLEQEAAGTISMEQVFVYMDPSGVLDLGGSGEITWTAPLGGNFEDLALWAEGDERFDIGGQSGNTLVGTFFTPFADPFRLTGQGGQIQTAAQFLTRRLEVSGQGQIYMTPDPERSTKLPLRGVLLIR